MSTDLQRKTQELYTAQATNAFRRQTRATEARRPRPSAAAPEQDPLLQTKFGKNWQIAKFAYICIFFSANIHFQSKMLLSLRADLVDL